MTAYRARRGRGDRGLAMVEFALVAPVVLLLVFAVFEFGFLWGNVNRVERSVQNAARTGSGLANSRNADYEALRSVESSLQGMDGATIERVIIYNSSLANGAPPADCLTIPATGTNPKGLAGQCNVYSPAQVASDNFGNFGSPDLAQSSCTTAAWDSAWCPTSRSRDRENPVFLGVFVEVEYSGRTQIIPGSMDVQRRAIYQIEPCKAGESTC